MLRPLILLVFALCASAAIAQDAPTGTAPALEPAGEGAPASAENFQSLSPGRQWRSWLRFAHTGEIYGLTGQTVAGLVTAGSVVLVYTGIALALRRFTAWIGRGRRSNRAEERRAA